MSQRSTILLRKIKATSGRIHAETLIPQSNVKNGKTETAKIITRVMNPDKQDRVRALIRKVHGA